MNILLLSYIMIACFVRLRYHKMYHKKGIIKCARARAYTHTHTHTHIYIYIIEWKMAEVPKIYI